MGKNRVKLPPENLDKMLKIPFIKIMENIIVEVMYFFICRGGKNPSIVKTIYPYYSQVWEVYF